VLLKDLASPNGVAELVRVTGGTKSFFNQPERADGIAQVVAEALKENPNLAHLKVRIMPNLPNCFYNYERGELILGLVNPDALAHELGHANRIKQEGLYQRILGAANTVARLNNVAALPTMLALRMFIQDPSKRNDILNALTAVSVAAAAPALMEEAGASAGALHHSHDRIQSMKTLGPAFLAHLASNMMPTLVYQAGRL